MTDYPLAQWDAKIAPLIVLLNRARQARDAFPPQVWLMVPMPFRSFMDAVFDLVEGYDRWIGEMREAGNLPPKPLTPSEERGL